MTAHTPGPWHISATHLGAARDIGAENGANVALVSGPKENGADEFKANARLISAAPEMYEALVYLADLFKDRAADQSTETGWYSDECCAVWEQARAAIAKAEGK